MWVIILFELLILAVLCVAVLRVFADFKKTPRYALITTWLGWLLCFAIVLMIPIDIVDSDHEKCLNDVNIPPSSCKEPLTYLQPSIMRGEWRVLYWGTFILSWLIFPILQSYSKAGDFTRWERLVRAIKENVYLYLGMVIVLIIFVIVLAAVRPATIGPESLNLTMALANAYGLILVVVLMGYGLVDIPRYWFRKADRERTLVFYQAQATKYKESMETAEEELTVTLKLVKKLADRVNEHDPFRPYIDTILQKCPMKYDEVVGDGDSGDLTYSKLAALHTRVIEDTHKVARAVCLYEMLLRKAFATEDIIRLKENGGSPDKKMHYSFRTPRSGQYAHYIDTAEYYWEMYCHTSVYRILGGFATLLSVLIVWCEITLVVDKNKVDLSPFSQLIKALHMQGFGKQLFCFIPLAYMAACAYTTLFKIKLVNYYRLVPHQMSDAHSIMFSANYLSRLAAPLAFNFLELVDQTDYSPFVAVMGQMDAFPFLGRDFTIFFPIFVAVLCLFSLFNVWSKIGSMCCIKSLRYIPEDDFKLVNDGEKILKDERDIKEGRGPTNKSFKESLKSSIKSATRKLVPGKNDDYDDNKAKPTPGVAAPVVPLSAAQAISMKYSRLEDGADLIPSSSKFSNSNINNSNSNSLPITSSSTAASRSSRSNNYEDLLPANSRFAKKNAAIIDVAPDNGGKDFAKATYSSSSATSSSTQKSSSVFGGLFGGKSRVDEIGLLPRGSARSDSIV